MRIVEYRPRRLHAKTLVVDDRLAIVGTSNFDSRSFRLGFEVVVALCDAEHTATLAVAFERDLAETREITRVDVGRAPWIRRLDPPAAGLSSPVL